MACDLLGRPQGCPIDPLNGGPTSRFIAFLCVALFALTACEHVPTAPLGAMPVHGVLITVAMPGRCLVGGCDPPGGDRTNLGLVTVVNSGVSTAYLHACGQYAAMHEQQLVDGQWTNVGPA